MEIRELNEEINKFFDEEDIVTILIYGVADRILNLLEKDNITQFIKSKEKFFGKDINHDGLKIEVAEDDAAFIEEYLQEHNFKYA